ncbi:MAG: LuxR C-terminal-related transcriptional regulator [Mycobacterium sp.]|nr:LuxR C-terminal-related transcriptional regulator [Mycobacterium sp.]
MAAGLRADTLHPAVISNGLHVDLHADLTQVARGALRDDLDNITFRWRGNNRLYRVTVAVLDGEAEVAVEPDAGLPVTTRELEVLTLLSGGLTNGEIASRLALSPRTVTTHVDRVLSKLGAASRTSAAIIAMNHGLILLPIQGDTRGLEHMPLIRASCAQPAPQLVPASRRIKLQPLLIGAAVPLTGQARSDGIEMVRGTELALGEVNARGGVTAGGGLGRRAGSSRAGVARRRALPRPKDVDAFTWGVSLRGSRRVARGVRGAEVMESGARHPSRYGRIFQVCPSDTNYGPGFVNFLQELRIRGEWQPPSNSLVVLQGGWEVTDLGLERAADLAATSGWQLQVVPVGPTERDWARCAVGYEISNCRGDGGRYFINGALAFSARSSRRPLPCLCPRPVAPEFRQRLGEQAEGIIWATTTGTYSDPVGTTFADSYRRAYGVAPGRSRRDQLRRAMSWPTWRARVRTRRRC